MSVFWALSNKKDFFYKDYWLTKSLYGKDYDVLDGEALISDFFRYDIDLMEWDKKTKYYCGVEGSGKTNLIRFDAWVLNKINLYQREGLISVQTNDLRIFGDKNYKFLFDGITIVNIIGDDALGGVGTNSAEFMHGSSIDVIKNFVRSRHIGREQGKKVGVVFMTFATQSYMALNPIIRENATLKVFTSYMDTEYFNKIFPFEETEFLRGKHHEAHVSSDWRERKYVIARTGAGAIVTLEVPFVPDCQEVLDWCKRNLESGEYVNDIVQTIRIESEEDFLRQNGDHHNKIYIVDRSISKDDIIDRLSSYLINHPKLKKLYKKHPKINCLEDIQRGKLKGILRKEARKIEENYCVKINKSDMVSVIDDALQQELFNYAESDEYDEEDVEPQSNKDWIKLMLKLRYKTENRKIFHIDEIAEMTGFDIVDVVPVLSRHKKIFANVIKYKGYWSLRSNMPTNEELKEFKKSRIPNYKKPLKKIIMT